LYCYDLLEKALPFDFDNGLKRANVTKEKLMFNKFEMYKSIPDKAKAMEYADKLIAINYKDPKIYTDIVKISLLDKDTAKALMYIEKGKALFEDNMDLIVSELDIYLARKKTNELIDKLKKAIEVSPDNELLHFILAVSYDKSKMFAEAEKEYLKAIELKPDYEPANYNLAVLYYNQGKEWNEKLNALGPKDTKIKEYEGKVNDNFKMAVKYFEISYDVTKDKKIKQLLRQMLLRLGETEKADKYK
jgi:tetratricopeptide (TPR) repeat protein